MTAGQIRDTLRRSVPARTLDGVKRRVRAGMGRCQSGFCSPKTMEIIAEETGIPLDQVKNQDSTAQSLLVMIRRKPNMTDKKQLLIIEGVQPDLPQQSKLKTWA